MRKALPLALTVASLSLAAFRQQATIPIDRATAGTLEAEREKNLEAFRTGYLPYKESLIERHAGDWLVIAGGLVMPTADGNPLPTEDLERALGDAEIFAPDAQHRFVFRVGEEGEIYYRPTLSSRPNYMGTQMLSYFGGNFWITPDGMYVTERGQEWHEGKRVGSGTDADDGPSFDIELAIHGATEGTSARFQVATGYTGYSVVSKQVAASIGLHRFEIPGGVYFHEKMVPMLRARVHFRLDGTDLDHELPVAIRRK